MISTDIFFGLLTTCSLHNPVFTETGVSGNTTKKGRVNGCYTIVDFDVFNGDSLEFRKLLLN